MTAKEFGQVGDDDGAGEDPPDALLRDLLLQRLPPQQAAALEQRLVIEAGVAERVRQVEYDLLDDYARGRLAADQRRAVEQRLLRTAADRQRLAVARGLAALPKPGTGLPAPLRARWSGTAVRSDRRRWLPAAALGGLAAALLLAVLLWPHQSDVPVPGEAPVAAARGGAVYTVSLLVQLSRGEGAQPVSVPVGTAQVRLQAEVEKPGAADVYELQLLDGDGRLLQAAPGLHWQRAGTHAYVEAVVPIAALAPGLRRIEVHAPGGVVAESWTVEASTGG